MLSKAQKIGGSVLIAAGTLLVLICGLTLAGCGGPGPIIASSGDSATAWAQETRTQDVRETREAKDRASETRWAKTREAEDEATVVSAQKTKAAEETRRVQEQEAEQARAREEQKRAEQRATATKAAELTRAAQPRVGPTSVPTKPKPTRNIPATATAESCRQARQEYERKLQEWRTYEPPTLVSDHTVYVLPSGRIDLESGVASADPPRDRQWDILYTCGLEDPYTNPTKTTSIQALDDVYWVDYGYADLRAIPYSEIRDADYGRPLDDWTQNYAIYYGPTKDQPNQQYVYLIRTAEGNVAKFQIVEYHDLHPEPLVCEPVTIRYTLYPPGPPRPEPPSCG
jgi:hypothetical protein